MWLTILAGCASSTPAPPAAVDEDAREAPAPAPAPAPTLQDCRSGLLGVLAGMPGLPAGAGRTPAADVALHDQPDGPIRHHWTTAGLVPEGGGDAECRGGWGETPCVTMPFAHEAMGLPVFAVRGSWAQVAAGPGPTALGGMADCSRRAWVPVAPPLEVLRLATLLRDAPIPVPLEGWDATLRETPGGAARPLGVEGPVHLTIHEVRDEGGRVWVDADVRPGEPCQSRSEPVERGWMPATDDAGRLQLWFFTDC